MSPIQKREDDVCRQQKSPRETKEPRQKHASANAQRDVSGLVVPHQAAREGDEESHLDHDAIGSQDALRLILDRHRLKKRPALSSRPTAVLQHYVHYTACTTTAGDGEGVKRRYMLESQKLAWFHVLGCCVGPHLRLAAL